LFQAVLPLGQMITSVNRNQLPHIRGGKMWDLWQTPVGKLQWSFQFLDQVNVTGRAEQHTFFLKPWYTTEPFQGRNDSQVIVTGPYSHVTWLLNKEWIIFPLECLIQLIKNFWSLQHSLIIQFGQFCFLQLLLINIYP
jgi:hypothetical protein